MNRIDQYLSSCLAVSATIVFGSPNSAVQAANLYSMTDLGVLPGGNSSAGLGIDTAGQIAGTSDAADPSGTGERGFLATESGVINLGLPPVPFVLSSAAPDLNDNRQVIVNGNNGAPHAFIWSNGVFTNITTLPDAVYSEGHRIDKYGRVVGSVVLQLPNNSFPHHAFLYTGQAMIDLNPWFGNDYSDALDINQDGAIVGEARFAGSSVIHGFLLKDGAAISLGPSPDITSEANAINGNELIVGGAYFDGVHERPMMYLDGQMTDLGLLPQASSGTATAVNDMGVIVGFCVLPNNHQRAFVYAAGQMKGLTEALRPDRGWIIEQANDINDSGEIAATARDAQNHRHAVKLTPRPDELGNFRP
jgi:probable HAF family extracellular repeat protein